MWVQVIKLRENGKKLSAEAIAAATPVTGHLFLWSYLDEPPTNDPTRKDEVPVRRQAAMLNEGPASSARSIMILGKVVVASISGAELVLHGRERVGTQAVPKELPQAWWCKIIAIDA